MPRLVRSKAKTTTAILAVSAALAVAWYVPAAAPNMAAAFFGTYLYSFAAGGVGWHLRICTM